MPEKQENSYKTRGVAAPQNHMVYNKYLGDLGIDDVDFYALKKRGLTGEQVTLARYATKLTNRSKRVLEALAKLRGDNINLEGVPGFYEDDKGHWTQSAIHGIMIPTRDVEGNISSLVVRNANPKSKAGKVQNKYVAFSSAGKPKGTKVYQTTHCPIIKGPAEDVATVDIRITEGVLKADITTALGEIYTIGLQGLKIHDDIELILDRLQISTAYIALDAGEDKNPDMIRAKGKLIARLQAHGVDVIVEKWDPKYGKGIDDVMANGHFDKVSHASDVEIEDMLEAANERDPLNGDWVYCISLERFTHIHDFTMLKKSQFQDMFHFRAAQDVIDLLVSGFPQVQNMTFSPGEDKFIFEGGKRCLNCWKDPEIVPEEGDIEIFLNHLRYLFPISEEEEKAGKEFSEEAEIFLDWMAYQVQNLGKRINWAMLIKGEEGIGKSAFQSIMGRLLGMPNVREVANEELHDKYTDFMKATSLIVIHEVMSRGRLDTMNKIKPLITQDTVQIREMYMPTYTQPNRASFLMFTNYSDSVLLSKDDRRYCILWSTAVMHKGNKERQYYSKLWDWIRSENMAPHLLYMLMARDLSDFNAQGKAPTTKAKQEAIKASRTGLEEWVEGCIEDKAWPFNGDVVNIRHLKDHRISPNGLSKFSDFKWAAALKGAGCELYPNAVQLSDGSKARLWVVRNHALHLNEQNHKSISTHLSKKYESHSLSFEPGGNPLEDSKPI